MKIAKSHLSVAGTLAGILSLCSCQTAPRSATFLPPQATAPAISAVSPAEPSVAPGPSKEVAAAPTVPEPAMDPAGELISRVEKEYLAGEDNYKAGHLEAAKQHF